MSSYTLRHGYIADSELIDECLLSVMRAPHSYTGEDVVEINCHGGYAVMRRILALVYRRGVRPAEPGEFTKRAFLNGRIDLSQAEAVSDLIQAKTEESRRAAVQQLSGSLLRVIRELSGQIRETVSRLEVALDYPEYEEDNRVAAEALASLESMTRALQALSASYDTGRIVREGLRTVLCGRPNAGKSSLLNAMLGADRAIVTDIAGTTRDTIEEGMDLDGFPLLVSDTAGLRDTEDPVERIGVERAYRAIAEADLAVFLADGESAPEAERQLLERIRAQAPRRLIVMVNKDDTLDEAGRQAFAAHFTGLTGAGFFSVRRDGAEPVLARIRDCLAEGNRQTGSVMLTNARHKTLIEQALDALSHAQESAWQGQPLDLIASDVWACARYLGEITGENVTDAVIDTIFSKFCLGK